MRTWSSGDERFSVTCSDQPAARRRTAGESGRWAESIVAEIPAAEMRTEELSVRICPAQGTVLHSFHYWVYQKL